MTDQSKIPMPAADDTASLIERAASAFDLRAFAPPPVPQGIATARPRPAVVETVAARAPEPVEPASPREAEPAPRPAKEPAVTALPRAQAAVGACHAIDRTHLRDQGLIVPEGGVTALLEEFRIVKRQVLHQAAAMRGEGTGDVSQRVLVCSPHPGEGKSYCAVNLALALAGEKETEVLLVDADFAKPSVLGTLGLPGGPGLMDALADASADVMDFVMATDVPGLSVLPAGSATTSDSEYLASSRASHVLDRLTDGAPQRLVIFDSPPALAASPAADLAKYAGQAIVVVRADRTGQGALEDAISLLSACPNIQLLLNAVSFSPSGRRFGSYYGYGE